MAKLPSSKSRPSDSEMSDPNALHEPTESEAGPQPARAYKGTQAVDHDLFKLNVAQMKKNMSYTDKPDIEKFEHCHIFHTVDSNGKKQDTSSATGGHFHEITVKKSATGVPDIEVGPPRKWVIKKVKGVKRKMAVAVAFGADPLEGDEGIVDDHTHTVTYLGSERITLRTPSVEFAKFESGFRANREGVVEGVRVGKV